MDKRIEPLAANGVKPSELYAMRLFLAPAVIVLALSAPAQSTYFPPLLGSTWDTLSPASLGWCADRIDSLYDFLEVKHTKGFLILKDGRIVLEKYFGTFTQDSVWYWASAGKTLTGFLIGQAQEQGYLDIDDPTSDYLGTGWTSCTPTEEAAITVRNQLTMTTGLDDAVLPDNDCTDPACLQYLADAGTRWAYHNAPYTLLRSVISSATGMTENQWTNQQVGSHIGMNGLWILLGWNNVYFSTPRQMARFGLLLMNRGVWANDTLLHDQAYLDAMTTPSQSLNESYGYLTWLNGQSSFMLPGLQFVFPGPLMPSAPPDLFAALGKNDQKIHVVPSQGLVVVRMGNAADSSLFATSAFDNALWDHINALECSTGVGEPTSGTEWSVFPNPCDDQVSITGLPEGSTAQLIDATGRTIASWDLRTSPVRDVSALPAGAYALRVTEPSGRVSIRELLKR